MKHISSRQHPDIKRIIKLHTTQGRKELGLFIAQGHRVCSSLLSGGMHLVQAYCTPSTLSATQAYIPSSQITTVDEHVMEKISTATSPSGILCVFTIPSAAPNHLLGPGLVLARITDPGNLGTIIRSAVAFGIEHIVLIECTDVWSPKVVQASAGVLTHIHLYFMTWDQLLHARKNIPLCALAAHQGKTLTSSFNNSLLVVGNEAHGIPEEWIAACQHIVSIPMAKNVESINAAVAVSIAAYLTFGTAS